MKITKQMAERITETLMQPKNELLKKQRIEFSKLLLKKIPIIVPKEVLKVYKSHPKYFRTGGLECYDLDHKREYFNINLPLEGYDNIKLKDLSGKEFDQVHDNFMSFCKSKDVCKKRTAELITTILSCSTVKVLEERFPEAYKAIPAEFFKEKSILPVKSIENLREWVSKKPVTI